MCCSISSSLTIFCTIRSASVHSSGFVELVSIRVQLLSILLIIRVLSHQALYKVKTQSIRKAPITSVLVDLLVYYLGLITECLKLVREPFSLGLVHRPVHIYSDLVVKGLVILIGRFLFFFVRRGRERSLFKVLKRGRVILVVRLYLFKSSMKFLDLTVKKMTHVLYKSRSLSFDFPVVLQANSQPLPIEHLRTLLGK